jgi:hypothetical protein
MSWRALEHVRTLQGVSVTVKAALFALAYRDSDEHQGSWPGMKGIAADAGLSLRAAQMSLREAQKLGIIRIMARKRADGSATSNFYQFVAITPPATVAPPPASDASLEKNIEKIQTTTAGVKPDKIFESIMSGCGPLYIDVSDPKRYSAAFSGTIEGFHADEFNAYLTKMDEVRRRHAKFVSKIEDPAQIGPLLVRPRDLRVLCALEHRTRGWSVSDLWDGMEWDGMAADGHNILQLAAERG